MAKSTWIFGFFLFAWVSVSAVAGQNVSVNAKAPSSSVISPVSASTSVSVVSTASATPARPPAIATVPTASPTVAVGPSSTPPVVAVPSATAGSATTISAGAIVPTESHNQFLERTSVGFPIGIDISQWQPNIWQNMADPGFSFIICKATEGNTWTDNTFKTNWKTTKRKNLVRGAYHFYLPNGTPIQQADHYLKTLNYWRLFWHKDKPSAHLPPIVDVETPPKGDITQFQNDLLAYLEYVEAKTHRRPLLYTYINFANKYLDNPKFAKYPLWIAHYTKDPNPIIPKTWKTVGAKFWQRSSNYQLSSYATDFNVYFGPVTDLRRGLVEDKTKSSQVGGDDGSQNTLN